MSAKPKVFKPLSNWHRLVHLLDLNGGTLYKAQLYKPRANYQPDHPEVITDGMPLLTERNLLSYAARYEMQASHMGWVTIQKHHNRAWVTLLPRGRSALKTFRDGKNWDVESQCAIASLHKFRKVIELQGDAE